MARHRRKFQRRAVERSYRKMYVLATEGTKTEPLYFNLFNSENTIIHVKCLKHGSGSDPAKILKVLKKHIKDEGLQVGDEAWVIVDRDKWTDGQLNNLHQWSQSAKNYGLAVSNPKFEYWLLLHFEDGSGITSPRTCSDRLRRHLPRYTKNNIGINKLQPGIPDAIRRAKQKDTPRCQKWPQSVGTTVYRLVEKLHPAN